jgi:hypothetical protein
MSRLEIEVDTRGTDVVTFAGRWRSERLRPRAFAPSQVMPAMVGELKEMLRAIENSSQGAV